MTLHQYDPANVKLVFGGALITGFGPDTFVSVEYSEDLFSTVVGADGEVARSKSNNHSAVITVTLMPGSTGNAVFGAALLADKAAGRGVLPIALTDLSTLTTHAGLEAWVVKDPNQTYAKESSPKEWRIAVARLESFHGAAVI